MSTPKTVQDLIEQIDILMENRYSNSYFGLAIARDILLPSKDLMLVEKHCGSCGGKDCFSGKHTPTCWDDEYKNWEPKE